MAAPEMVIVLWYNHGKVVALGQLSQSCTICTHTALHLTHLQYFP